MTSFLARITADYFSSRSPLFRYLPAVAMCSWFWFSYPWLHLFIFHFVIISIGNAEENFGGNLDAQIAFDVPGAQQPISFVSDEREHASGGFVVYCPCMGR